MSLEWERHVKKQVRIQIAKADKCMTFSLIWHK